MIILFYNDTIMKHNLWMKLILTALWILLVAALYIWVVIRIWSTPENKTFIKCDERYVWDSYRGEIEYKDWDYIYLSWYKSIDVICAIDEADVDERTPLCWTVVEFSWPLDTSNMNCYEEWNPKSILKAFKKQADAEKKEDERYYTCNIDSSYVIELYNGCETVACAENRLRNYLEQECPRATVK